MPLFRRKSEKQPSNPLSVPSSSRLPRSASNDSGLTPSSSWNGFPQVQRPQSLLLSDPGLLRNSDIPAEALESPMRTTSRLSKTLKEVLKDKDALSCFINFMKSRGADQLIQFWCDAQSFQAATLMRMRTHALQSVSRSNLMKRRSGSLMKGEGGTGERTRSSSTPGSGEQFDDTAESEEAWQEMSNPKDSSSNEKSHSCSDTSSAVPPKNNFNPNSSHAPPATKSALDVKPNNDDNDCTSKLSSQPCDTNSSSLSTLYNQSPALPSLPSGQTDVSDSSHGNLDCLKGHQTSNESCSHPTVSLHEPEKRLSQPSTGVEPSQHIPEDGDAMRNKCDELYEIKQSDSEDNSVSGPAATSKTSSAEDVTLKLKKSVERDAVTVFSMYVAKDAPRPIGVDDRLRADTISKICQEDGNVDPECFQQCQEFVVVKMDAEYFQSFKDSEFHCCHQINVLTSGQVFLPDVLLADNALVYFMEYMEQEGASDLMLLWLALENFQKQLTHVKVDHDWEQAQNDAMVIYDKYFSLQATHPMGFDDKLRFEIESNICREGGPLPDCFSKAKVVVLTTLDKVHFGHYLNSQVFHRYLSDLVSTVQMAEDLQHKQPMTKGHRRNASDASSEHSIGSQSTGPDASRHRNTLLAVDTRKVKKGTPASTQINGDFSMSLDMFNPDDLWKRTSPGGMSLGSVDELGQFVSGFESDVVTDKRKGSSFLKRWKDKDKEQEEMALKIAQMIIKDVNSMTRSTDSLRDNVTTNDNDEGS